MRLVAAFVAVVAAASTSCSIRDTVPHPTFPNGGMLDGAAPVPALGLARLDGMYQLRASSDVFGSDVVAVKSTDSTVSIFGATNAAYAVMKAGCIEGGSKLVLEGAWRFPESAQTGLIRMFVAPAQLAKELCTATSAAPSSDVVPALEGHTGAQSALPSVATALDFRTALKKTEGRFDVVGHHGACSTIDDCGASENTLESIRIAESFGIDVVELDVHVTADGVPVLFHDDVLSTRLTDGLFCHGAVDEMTLANLRASCKAKFGETIPTLDEALATVVDETRLRGVWLDMKVTSAVAPSVEVVTKYRSRTAGTKRRVNFVIGLSDSDLIATWQNLSPRPPAGTLCLAETSVADARAAGCPIWGPRWTSGPSASDVAAMQATGGSVVFWTMDDPSFIDLYLQSTTPNGIVTDRPGLVFHRFQTLGTLPPSRDAL